MAARVPESNTENQAVDTYRTETGDFYYAGISSAGAGTQQTTSYEYGYNQRNNDLKSSTLAGYTPSGKILNALIKAKFLFS